MYVLYIKYIVLIFNCTYVEIAGKVINKLCGNNGMHFAARKC